MPGAASVLLSMTPMSTNSSSCCWRLHVASASATTISASERRTTRFIPRGARSLGPELATADADASQPLLEAAMGGLELLALLGIVGIEMHRQRGVRVVGRTVELAPVGLVEALAIRR